MELIPEILNRIKDDVAAPFRRLSSIDECLNDRNLWPEVCRRYAEEVNDNALKVVEKSSKDLDRALDEISQLKKQVEDKHNELLDALDLKEGNGPTALANLKQENERLKSKLEVKEKPDFEIEWKDIPGYEGMYQACTNGEIRSLDRTVEKSLNGKKFNHSYKGRAMVKRLDKDGYLETQLSKNGKVRHHRICRLVAETFIRNTDGKHYVNHKDGVKINDQASNLEWVTARENTQHAIQTGLLSIKGHRSPNSKLSQQNIADIIDAHNRGISNALISKHFKVSKSCIQKITSGISYRTDDCDAAIAKRDERLSAAKSMMDKYYKDVQERDARIVELEKDMEELAKSSCDEIIKLEESLVASIKS